jgi:hypothetical protein
LPNSFLMLHCISCLQMISSNSVKFISTPLQNPLDSLHQNCFVLPYLKVLRLMPLYFCFGYLILPWHYIDSELLQWLDVMKSSWTISHVRLEWNSSVPENASAPQNLGQCNKSCTTSCAHMHASRSHWPCLQTDQQGGTASIQAFPHHVWGPQTVFFNKDTVGQRMCFFVNDSVLLMHISSWVLGQTYTESHFSGDVRM